MHSVNYADDITACNEYAQSSAANLRRAALFVLATVQQHLETVPVIVTDFVDYGVASRFAWGSKKRGIEYVIKNKIEFYSDAMAARDNDAALMSVFLRVPGLGLVKAGFLCQIFAGTVGCIDTHNVKLYGIKLSSLRYNYNAKEKTRDDKINQYIALCDGLGGAVNLWSRWCDYVAALRPNNWAHGGDVSAFHYDVISGLETGAIVDLFSDVDFDPKYKAAA